MSDAAIDAILDYLTQSREVLQAAIGNRPSTARIHDIAEVTAKTLRNGKKGPLGRQRAAAAGDAQHLPGRCCCG